MANYVERNLRQSEHIIAKAQVSWVAIVPSLIIGGLIALFGFAMLSQRVTAGVGIGILVFAALLIVITILRISNIELGVTDKKIIGKSGIIVANSLDAYLEKIDNFSISETIGGRLFGYATIMICTISSKIRFPYIKDAMKFKNLVMDCYDERERTKMSDQANFINSGSNGSKPAAPAPAQAPQMSYAQPRQQANTAPQDVTCPYCGLNNDPRSAYCLSCGKPLR